jgi:hypothetical protein
MSAARGGSQAGSWGHGNGGIGIRCGRTSALMTVPSPFVFFVLTYFRAFVIKVEAGRHAAVRSPRIDGTGRT